MKILVRTALLVKGEVSAPLAGRKVYEFSQKKRDKHANPQDCESPGYKFPG